MPHGHLTPLGRQLRTVLANLSSFRPEARARRTRTHNGVRDFHNSASGRLAADSIRTVQEPSFGEHSTEPSGQQGPVEPQHPSDRNRETFQPHRWKRLTARMRTNHLSEALEYAGHSVPPFRMGKDTICRTNADSRNRIRSTAEKNPTHVTFQGILARYILDGGREGETEPMQTEGEPSFVLSSSETEFLHDKRFSMDDVREWAEIVLAVDSSDASKIIAARVKSRHDEPLFVLMHSLRRENISAHALRTILISISTLLQAREAHFSNPRRKNPTLLMAIALLLRHAREVWPQSMPSIVSIFLGHLQHQDSTRSPASIGELQFTTFALNKIMSLVSLSTAVMPFKDNTFQELAIIPVLQHMDAHDPPLQITRPGYRAVIRIQLGQKKTSDEQQWAELKALSWPPWKVDRTAMDASVGLEYGISRARATLFSMRSAGYAPLAWEKAAEVYTGWDPDGTPTVQWRALLGSPGSTNRHDPVNTDGAPKVLHRVTSGSPASEASSNSNYWAARIESTRTIQEAWACYLAWEDAKLPQDQSVYLTTMQKLQRVANPQRDKPLADQNPAWDLLPGDTPQLSPLPPSTHLYTYTRTVPPNLDDFYQTLRNQGVQFTGHCLAFLLRNSSLQTGLARLKDSLPHFPDLWGIITLDPTYDVNKIPQEIFTAAVQLLSRSGGYFLNDRKWRFRNRSYKSLDSPAISDRDQHLDVFYQNKTSVIVRAIELLCRRPNCTRQAWVAVFVGLTRESNFPGLGQALNASNAHIDVNPPEEVGHLGALLAYGMTRRLVTMYRKHFSDLDSVAFHRVCLVTESMARSIWKVELMRDGDEEIRRVRELMKIWDYDGRYIASGVAGREIRSEFAALVGNMEGGDTEEVLGGARLPRLLFIPNPAMLHVYIRALGWLGDFEGLRELVRWMREFSEEIEERKGRDRLGKDMFRKAIVALRVFLERTWKTCGRNCGDGNNLDTRMSAVADGEVVDEVRSIVESVQEWEGWATDEEVWAYVADQRFDGLRGQ